ncbi:hypothetical protein GCM10028808_30290 [Spirosoma migulaei]
MERSKEIGRKIKSLREAKGLTQEEFAKLMHKGNSTISHYELGRNNFTVATLDEIAEALGCELQINFLVKS